MSKILDYLIWLFLAVVTSKTRVKKFNMFLTESYVPTTSTLKADKSILYNIALL